MKYLLVNHQFELGKNRVKKIMNFLLNGVTDTA